MILCVCATRAGIVAPMNIVIERLLNMNPFPEALNFTLTLLLLEDQFV